MSEKKESAPDVPATLDISSIAVIGGTGGLGSALAWCWGRAGFKIFIGSRNAEKAELAADKLNTTLTGRSGLGEKIACGLSNQEAASLAQIIVLTVPFANHEAIIEGISSAVQGKIVVDTTVPLVPPKVVQWQKGRKKSSAKMCAWFPLFKLSLRQSWQKTHQVPVWWAKFWFAEIMWMRELVSFLSLKRQDSKAGTPDPLTILLSANPSHRFSFSSTNAIKWRAPASELSGIDV